MLNIPYNLCKPWTDLWLGVTIKIRCGLKSHKSSLRPRECLEGGYGDGLVLLAGRQVSIPVYNARLADIRGTCANSNAKSEMDYYINREAMPIRMLAIDRRGGRACDSDTPYWRDACINPIGRLYANLGKVLGHLGLSRW
ncbi:hypothetical protein RF11_14310 [Thelohanellus kitauei]|uniref:Uncharacterized protein n=1 Tax=Thelohanellus kitauei TaxID=669202 RepID=A0A0C2MK50_THEKT|nr:hypothetical protein RF11_14310 [Thelohanellus kitauei]